MKRLTEATKAALLVDYQNGMSTSQVAQKYGISASGAHRYVAKAGISRTIKSAKTSRYNAEYGLGDGHWTPRRGVLVWQPCFYNTTTACNLNHQENRNAA